MTAPSSEFKRILSAGQIEQAVIALLQTWFSTYAREVERQQNLNPNVIRTPKTWTTRNRYTSIPGEELPKCVVVSPGLAGPPHRLGNGQYNSVWRLGVAVAESYSTEEYADTLSKSMAAVVRAILVQKPNLNNLGTKIRWVDETYSDMPSNTGSRVMNAKVCSVFFTIDIDDTTTGNRGPSAPDLPPNEYNYGQVATVDIDLELEAINES